MRPVPPGVGGSQHRKHPLAADPLLVWPCVEAHLAAAPCWSDLLGIYPCRWTRPHGAILGLSVQHVIWDIVGVISLW